MPGSHTLRVIRTLVLIGACFYALSAVGILLLGIHVMHESTGACYLQAATGGATGPGQLARTCNAPDSLAGRLIAIGLGGGIAFLLATALYELQTLGAVTLAPAKLIRDRSARGWG